jgi:hypothetical protein
MPETSVALEETDLIDTDFPLKIKQAGILRDIAHTACGVRHVTCLLICLLVEESPVKWLVMNKREKNLRKHPGKAYPARCLDIPGGHFVFTPDVARAGILGAEVARDEALRELNSEVISPKEFTKQDLIHLFNLRYDAPENCELRVVYAVRLAGEVSRYGVADDIQKPDGTYEDITLPVSGYSYEELRNLYAEQGAGLMVHDGLSQLLSLNGLPSILLEKTGLRIL